MAQTNDAEVLRSFIQLFPPVRQMRDDLERILQMDFYEGIGDVSLRSFQSLLDSVAQITADTFVKNLVPSLTEDATDKEKVWQSFLASGQLVAYLEGQIGLVLGSGTPSAVHPVPSIHIGELHLPAVTTLSPFDKVIGAIARATEDEEKE